MKSTVKRIKEIETSKELEITKLFADKAALEAHRQKLQTMFKNETQEQINVKINNLIARDNAFNAAMNEIVKCYEVNIDQTEWDNAFNNLKTKYPTHKEEFLRNLSKHTIIKTLIFQDLAQLWGIKVSDDDARESLENFYKLSNEPIREYLENKEKFQGVKEMLLHEKIVNEILRKFKFNFNIQPPPPPVQEPQKNN